MTMSHFPPLGLQMKMNTIRPQMKRKTSKAPMCLMRIDSRIHLP